jgi:hypothetical protein
MTTKKADNPFGLAPITPLPSISSNDYRLTRRNSEMTRRERATVAEWRVQMLTIEAQKSKTIFGEYVLGDIHEYAAATFAETASNIWTIKESVRIPELQVYTDAFCHRQIQLAGRHMEQAALYGAENILKEIERSSRIELPKPTFWQRLFGQLDDF